MSILLNILTVISLSFFVMEESLKKAFGQTLINLRKREGLSQEKLANMSDLDRSYISRLEQGHYSPSLKALFQLSKSLKIEPEEFIVLLKKNW